MQEGLQNAFLINARLGQFTQVLDCRQAERLALALSANCGDYARLTRQRHPDEERPRQLGAFVSADWQRNRRAERAALNVNVDSVVLQWNLLPGEVPREAGH